jgi:hypothetical protein
VVSAVDPDGMDGRVVLMMILDDFFFLPFSEDFVEFPSLSLPCVVCCWCEYACYITWSQFVEVVYARFEKDIHYFLRLVKLCQIGSVTEFMATFEQLAIHT